jgi:Na+/proline symporter
VFCSLASSIDSLLAATSDVVTKEIVQPLLMPDATNQQLRRVASYVIVLVGLLTWGVCLPRVGTLATVLFFAGPLVGSTIWPILTGLYWRRASPTGAVLAMLLGSAFGLVAYFQIGWYSGALVGTGVSCLITLSAAVLTERSFEWSWLRTGGQEATA